MATYYLLGKSAWEGDGYSILEIGKNRSDLEKTERSDDMTKKEYNILVLTETECKRKFGTSVFELMKDDYYEAKLEEAEYDKGYEKFTRGQY